MKDDLHKIITTNIIIMKCDHIFIGDENYGYLEIQISYIRNTNYCYIR